MLVWTNLACASGLKIRSGKHLLVTYMVALGSNLSALWILIANGYMQKPTGSAFNPDTMRMS